MHSELRYKITKRASIISAITNSTLAALKIFFGIIGHSQALIADGLHSFSDLITDGLVLLAAKAGGQRPDKEHPYGHRRIETVATIVIAIVLMVVAISIVIDTLTHILQGKPKFLPSYSVVIVAFISIIANEGLYRYMNWVGKKINSALLISNAWHNRSDAFTSLIVLISVVGTLLGFYHLDSIGAIVIALFILKIGINIMWNGIKEVIDTAVDEKTLQKIRSVINQVPGVKSIHQLRTRLHSGIIFVDVHIIVDPFISVSEGHYIGEQVHLSLLNQVEDIEDVTVHIDPEDDEASRPSEHLPSRDEINEKLKKRWQNLPGFSQIQRTTLHYIEGRLYIEIFMPQKTTDIKDQKNLIQSYKIAVKDMNEIASVAIHFMP